MDWSEKNLCIKCDRGGNLLACNENGCPLAMHERCMGCPARFDDARSFYCPYCSYKQAVAESRRARECALARKKALLAFMDDDVVDREKPSETNEGSDGNGRKQSNNDEDKVSQESDSVREQSVNLDEEDDIEAPTIAKDQEPSVQVPPEQNTCDEKEIEEEIHETSGEEQGRCNAEEEKVERESEISRDFMQRERAERALKTSKLIDMGSEGVSVRSKSDEQSDKNKQTSSNVSTPRRSSRRLSSASGTEEATNKQVKVSKRLKKDEAYTVKIVNDSYGSEKRKRLLWSDEEEDTLKAGVEKYSKGPGKKLSWKDILEMGSKVFDKSRNPSDLRSKWKSMSRT